MCYFEMKCEATQIVLKWLFQAGVITLTRKTANKANVFWGKVMEVKVKAHLFSYVPFLDTLIYKNKYVQQLGSLRALKLENMNSVIFPP